jgi:hypothetical protein
MPAETRHRCGSFVEIRVNEVAPVLSVELRDKARRPDEIAKHHCDRAALGRDFRTLGGRRLWRRNRDVCARFDVG